MEYNYYIQEYYTLVFIEEEEKNLNKLINKIDKYQNYLYNIYLYLTKYYDIPIPEWLKKRRN